MQMHPLTRLWLLTLLLIGLSLPAVAIDKSGYAAAAKEGEFNEVFEDLKDAILNRGLVIDYVGHVDTMLVRTSEAAESVTETGRKSPYLAAKYVQFCSAKLTHEAVSANPFNIAVCPYVLFAFEEAAKPGTVVVGYRRPIPGRSRRTRKAFEKIEGLLNEIIEEATRN